MAEGSYQVIFSGHIVDGAELDMVKQNVARVFNLDAERVEKLFCGRRLILKKQIDQATAEKYQTTMQRAGALCEIENTAQVSSKAESVTGAAASEAPPGAAQTPTQPSRADAGIISLAEPGIQLIEPAVVPEANIDTSGMDMAEVGIQLTEPGEVPEVNIDTSAIDMAEVGIELVEHEAVPEVNIDTSGMDMAEAGIQLVEPSEVPEAEFDTSGMSLDAPGVQLVEAKEVPPANIDISHLSAE
jgi:hypothetical protein